MTYVINMKNIEIFSYRPLSGLLVERSNNAGGLY